MTDVDQALDVIGEITVSFLPQNSTAAQLSTVTDISVSDSYSTGIDLAF